MDIGPIDNNSNSWGGVQIAINGIIMIGLIDTSLSHSHPLYQEENNYSYDIELELKGLTNELLTSRLHPSDSSFQKIEVLFFVVEGDANTI